MSSLVNHPQLRWGRSPQSRHRTPPYSLALSIARSRGGLTDVFPRQPPAASLGPVSSVQTPDAAVLARSVNCSLARRLNRCLPSSTTRSFAGAGLLSPDTG